MTCPFKFSVLICIVIVAFAISAGPVSAAPDPRITSVSPSGGPMAGGTIVTITGSGFTSATAVQFGGKTGSSLDVISDSSLRVITPPHDAGTVAISIISTTGVITSGEPATMFQYEEVSLPRISGVSPPSGPVTGDTVVTITGSGFNGAENVRFGDKYARDLKVIDDSHLTISTPASSPGLVSISVRNAAGTGISSVPSAMFLYDFPRPELTGISPSSGSTAGGTVVTVTGSGLSGATDVRFGGISGTGLNVIDNSQLTVVSPPNPGGTVGLTVVNPDYTGSSAGPATVFRYEAPVPRLTGISPSSGSAAGGTLVTLTGSGFNGTKLVTFAGKSGTELKVIDDRHLTIITPSHSPGSVPISITNALGDGGSLGPATMFQYINYPATTPVAVNPPVPVQGTSDSGDTPVLSPVTSPAPAAVTATSETVYAPGFEALFGISALCVLFLVRKTIP